MIKVCKKCGKKYDEGMKRCPICDGKLSREYTQEELEKIKKENDDMLIVNTFFM